MGISPTAGDPKQLHGWWLGVALWLRKPLHLLRHPHPHHHHHHHHHPEKHHDLNINILNKKNHPSTGPPNPIPFPYNFHETKTSFMRIRMDEARNQQLHQTRLRGQAHSPVPQVLRQLAEVQAIGPGRGQDAALALGTRVGLKGKHRKKQREMGDMGHFWHESSWDSITYIHMYLIVFKHIINEYTCR